MNKAAALLVAASASSCSPLFMETLPKGYEGGVEPRCTTSVGWPVIDLLSAVGDVIVMAAAKDGPDRNVIWTVFGIDAVISLGAAVWGFSSSTECARARAEWDGRHGDSESNYIDPRWSIPVADAGVPVVDAAAAFHCTSSPDGSKGICARTIEGCELGQDALLAEGSDAKPCTEASAAVCFSGASGERCFPTVGMCRTAWAAVDDVVTDCEDAR